MNNKVGRTRRTGLFLSGKPDHIRKELLALQQRYGPDMPLSYVLSLRTPEYTRPVPENRPLPAAPQAI
ncbi:hypothetical protein G5B47_04110 [Paenibacillus sp. 7124]|uniref:Uncharacterized protein n=1 Tax=Paenibacillus apii TaxID=1850370 RepID=A0A6M1PGE7_9BACL|nr:hypothetical protein [Paenibacillus apii]NGM81592.1 hypothetical protein [Paenibacillus apii]NJJ41426.1 hypothetical protein [Paenibacillus apii]